MKKNLLLITTAILFNCACKKNQSIEMFNTDQSYIYFAVLNPSTSASKIEKYIDSTAFSFVFEDINLTTKKIGIPINVIGVAKDYDRALSYKINPEKTTINTSDIEVEAPKIRKGRTTDSLFIHIKKTDALRGGIYYLMLDLQDNDQFKVGHLPNQQIRISVTNKLTKPVWWDRWKAYFGTTYYQEIYQFWIQMYPLGSDPSPDIYGVYPAPYYFWDNMPPSATASSYPVTFMYIAKLRNHFLNNQIYPNGDTTQPRILLP